MKKRRMRSILLCVCLLLGGCGTGKESVDTVRQETAEWETVTLKTAMSKIVKESAVCSARAETSDWVLKRAEQKAAVVITLEPQTIEATTEEAQSEAEVAVLEMVEQMAAEQSAVLDAYEHVLTEWLEEEPWSKEIPTFALIYLDNDDIPELAVIGGTAHSQGASIYTYERGEAVFVEEYGEYGWAEYREKEGIIFSEWSQGGIYNTRVYQVDGSRGTLLLSYEQQCDRLDEADPKPVYMVDDVEVSEEQYEEAAARYDIGEMRIINYEKCTLITEPDIRGALTKELEALILSQEEMIRQRVLAASGMTEDRILMMDYDDYDRDGKCEAFMFCGEYNEYNELQAIYSGELWFAGAQECKRLSRESYGYRMIDGSMVLGRNQKYIYLYTDRAVTANYSELWTVENGKPVEIELPQRGQIVYREGDSFEVWADEYDHWYEPEDDLWTGHTYRPYFYYYNWDTKMFERYEETPISAEQLARICGFDLAAEIEAEGYEVTEIVKWDNGIVTVNYTIPLDENDPIPEIAYENIIWDCTEDDYWRREARGVTSWRDAGFGGSF